MLILTKLHIEFYIVNIREDMACIFISEINQFTCKLLLFKSVSNEEYIFEFMFLGCGASNTESFSARDGAVFGAPLEQQNELRAPSAHHAAYYLDAAIAARTVPGTLLMMIILNFKFQLKFYFYVVTAQTAFMRDMRRASFFGSF